MRVFCPAIKRHSVVSLKISLFLFLCEFSTLVLADGLSLEFEWQQVSSSLQDSSHLNNALIWMVSTRPLTSKSSSPWINLLVTVPRVPITSGITVTFMFLWQSQGIYPSFCFLSISLCGLPGQQSTQLTKFSFSGWLLIGLVVWQRLGDTFVSRNLREFVRLIPQDRFLVLHYYCYYYYYCCCCCCLFVISCSLSWGPYLRPSVWEDSDYMYSIYLWFCYLFWAIFFSHINSTFLRK